MLTLTNALLDGTIQRLGYPARSAGELVLVGLRGARPVSDDAIASVGCGGTTDSYDDTIVAYGPTLRCFAASVDPGATYTRDPENPAGCAHLCNGSYLYEFGDHKGHAALVEAAPVRIWRDGLRSGIQDARDRVETGVFGIHIHSGGPGPHVGPWSAGCQVLRSNPAWGEPWTTFLRILQGSGQTRFTYYLLDAVELSG